MKFMRTQAGATQSMDRIDIPKSWPLPTSENLHSQPIEDPAKCTEWRSITNPDEIESYIRFRNRGHFGQAQGTPFTELPLREDITWQADTVTCEDILNGHHQTDTIKSIPQCQALLNTCKVATELDLIPYYISEKEFKHKIKVWRETTTTSPSGRHLGHYKTLFTKMPSTQEVDEPGQPSFADKQAFIRHSILLIINYCLRNGYSLHRWQTIVNTMIF